ncbi:uncharacterized protein LOC111919768 [Lactuca sativa]|uniref:uncharacterized protein LOC111919768 n=1 Tax=Lactuca sativa TaxID=4236 RepID=UPI000CD9639E|nr:uncharacterized protein LOC111919768 [Lactuca sativa]
MASRYLSGVWKNIDKCKITLGKLNIADFDVIRRNQVGNGWESDFKIDGQFCITALRERIDRAVHMIPDGVFQWSKWIPFKVSCFIWRARMDRIPTAVALDQRGVQVHSTQCSACISGMESMDHMLLKCPFVVDLWNRIWEWCGITPIIFSSIKEMLTYIAMTGQCPKRRTTLLSIISGALWGIWRARNDRIFN